MKTILRFPMAKSIAAMFMILLQSMLATSVAFSQARLVKDINTAENRLFNEYSQLTNAHGLFYFVSLGKELWKSDGTIEGTVRIKALRVIENLTLIGNTLYFAGKDQNGLELWKSDGTPAGTVSVKDIRPGVYGSAPDLFTDLNGTVFFVANDGRRGDELWKTDGTSAGTVLVKDVRKGKGGSKPLHLTAMSDKLYFTAYVGRHGRELWRTDGSGAGTTIVKDIERRPGRSSDPEELVALNGLIYFTANHSVSGRELWQSDGTARGTAQLKDINPGNASSGITSIRRMGNNIYFNANNGTTGTALWRSNGTQAGTAMVKDVTTNNFEFRIHDMTTLNDRLYWVAETYRFVDYEMPGYEVWVSDGSAAGTRLAATFETRYTPARFTFMNNKVFYFSGYFNDDEAVDDIFGPFQQLSSINPDGSEWQEIWQMQRTFGVDDETQYHYFPEIIAFNNTLIFPGVRQHGESYKLLKSDGTHGGESVIIDTYMPTQSSSPNAMVRNNSGVYFRAVNNTGLGQQLWHTDGTSQGTVLLKTGQGMSGAINIDNTAYFMRWGDGSGYQLWKTDGTPEGTIFVKDLDREPQFLDVAETLFFYNDAGEVWKSDGTTAGTVLVKTFAGIEHAVVSGDVAYIMVITASAGQELWKSGSSGEMEKVKTIRSYAGPRSSNYRATATLANIFYFVGHDGIHGHEVWRTDGTDAGTYIFYDINTGDEEDQNTDIWSISAFKDAIYINARDAAGELSLFKSDGTNSGTSEIHDSHVIRQYIPYNDQLLFISDDGTTTRLFSTDGTSAGTTMLHILPPVQGLWISNVLMEGILYFGYLGSDLIWRTDGTVCGTLGIDVGVKKVDNLTAAGDNLMIFSAHHDFYGEELFSIHASSLPKSLCAEAFTAGPTSELSAEHEAGNVTYAPNPFNSDFTVIVNSDSHATAEVVVQDMAGQPMMSQILDTNKTYRLGNNWRDGIYVMRIYVDGKVTHKRIVKGGQ